MIHVYSYQSYTVRTCRCMCKCPVLPCPHDSGIFLQQKMLRQPSEMTSLVPRFGAIISYTKHAFHGGNPLKLEKGLTSFPPSWSSSGAYSTIPGVTSAVPHSARATALTRSTEPRAIYTRRVQQFCPKHIPPPVTIVS